VYGTCVGNALKWFPGRRGLAAGITAAGFGAGAAITIGPIDAMIKSAGYQHAFLVFGLIQGGIVLLMSWGLEVAPASLQAAKIKVDQTAHGYTPAQVLRSPCFWVLYLMFVLVAAGGLTMTASVVPIAKDFGIDKEPVELFGWLMAAGVFATSLSRIFDGVGRPFFGWLSDQIGREYTMAIAFVIGAGALYTLSQIGTTPVAFVLVVALYFGVYGEIFSLFPATQGDTFGAKYAAANAGMLYTAKGSGALLVPFAAAIAKANGWNTVFMIAMGFNLLAAGLALLVLRPLRARHFAISKANYTAGAVGDRRTT
jgi:MFS transporter, OFA family, oxalate/formate antiporter